MQPSPTSKTSPDPVVSVVIPAYGCEKTIHLVLDSLFRQTFASIEIIVVNDCSPDNLDQAIAPFLDRIQYIRNDLNMGLSHSYNTGIQASRGRYIMTLHCDCLIDAGYIEGLLSHFGTTPSLGAVTGQYLVPDVNKLSFSDHLFLDLNRISIESDRSDKSVGTISFIEGKADLFDRDILIRYGGFNTDLIYSAEDQDLSIKMRRDGYIFLQDSRYRFTPIFGLTTSSVAKVLLKQRLYARGQAYIALKYRQRMLGQTTKSRDQRSRHRAYQLGAGFLVTFGTLLTPMYSQFSYIVLAVLTIRGLFYFNTSSLGYPERLTVLLFGNTADFLYWIGMIEGTIKTMFGRRV
jgi:glycosyltransferase involved in cell wall biosynthesis